MSSPLEMVTLASRRPAVAFSTGTNVTPNVLGDPTAERWMMGMATVATVTPGGKKAVPKVAT